MSVRLTMGFLICASLLSSIVGRKDRYIDRFKNGDRGRWI